MIGLGDDIGDEEVEDDLVGGHDAWDAAVPDDPVASQPAALAADPAPMGTGPVALRRGRRGGGWVSLLLLAGAGVALFGLVSALANESVWGVILNGAAAGLCVVGAVVERSVRGAGRVGMQAMRAGHYVRLALVVVVLVAVVRYGAEEDGGLDAVAWHVPAALFAAAVFVQWWRDPQRAT